MLRALRALPAALALALFAGPAHAASPTPAPAACNAPAHAANALPFNVGALYACKYGSGPKTVLLLPGTAAGAFIWNSTVAALAPKYTVFAVTFAGFDGFPPARAPYLDAFTAAVVELIHEQHIEKPILVGHSLGGAVALRIAASLPSEIAGVVTVDTPTLSPPLSPGESMDARSMKAATIANRIDAMPESDFRSGERRTISAMVRSPADAETLTDHALRSDRPTLAGTFMDLATTDLGPLLPRITVPVLAIAASSNLSPQAAQQLFEQQYKGTARLTVRVVPDSKHFVMYDQPSAFLKLLNDFLASLG